jgi:hypothetical protein
MTWKTSIRPLVLIFFLNAFTISGQPYPQDYFQAPLDIPILLSGNFCELRSNHFHSGIDIKTQGVIGANVFAAAEGYVSRIKISPTGYGKALYITHPNGFTTVYAHLHRFNDAIEAYTRKRQYNEQSFEVDLFPGRGVLEVSKGEIIALSGNSGSSGGPHLHFEIRETASEKPVNPMLFGLGPTDRKPPVINGLQVHPLENGASVNGSAQVQQLILRPLKQGVWTTNTIRAGGPVGFSVNAYDQQDGSENQNGIYRMTLLVDNEERYKFEAEKFPFSDTRYLNAHIDYARFVRLKNRYQKAYVEPGNKLRMYPVLVNRGILMVPPGESQQIRIILEDLSGNKSEIAFEVLGEERRKVEPPTGEIRHHLPYAFQTEYFRVHIPAGTLYHDLTFDYAVKSGNGRLLSDIHRILSEEVPAHIHYSVSIAVPEDIRKHGHQLCLVQVSANGNGLSYEGGSMEGGFLTASVRSFGSFALTADTIPPEIIPVNIRENANMRGQKQIRIRISDQLSGISSYRGTINGKWILMEYDAKNNLLTYDFDEVCPQGENTLLVTVTDKRGNSSKYEVKFQR